MKNLYKNTENLLDIDDFAYWHIEKYYAEIMVESARSDAGSTVEERRFWVDRNNFLDSLPWGKNAPKYKGGD